MLAKLFFITIVFITPMLIGAGCNAVRPAPSPSADYQQPSEPTSNAQVPGLTLKDYSGKDVSLRNLAGKPLVINSWASWCPFCTKELSDFASLQKEFGDSLIVVAVNRGESLEVAKKYTDQLTTSGNVFYLLDPTDSFYQAIGAFSMPETIFVDAEGNIIDHKRGPMELEEMRTKVKNLFP